MLAQDEEPCSALITPTAISPNPLALNPARVDMPASKLKADIAKILAPMPIGTPFPSPPHHAVAVDTVRYAGEPVAAVFAEDAYIAEDAAALVIVEIEPLPVVLDASAATGEFSPGRSTEPTLCEQGFGDVPAAFQRAHAVVELDLKIGRHTGVPIETRGAIGVWVSHRW